MSNQYNDSIVSALFGGNGIDRSMATFAKAKADAQTARTKWATEMSAKIGDDKTPINDDLKERIALQASIWEVVCN